MTAGVPGTGPYSKLKDLRFERRTLENLLANPSCMGKRKAASVRAMLKRVKKRLKMLNAEIREAKKLS